MSWVRFYKFIDDQYEVLATIPIPAGNSGERHVINIPAVPAVPAGYGIAVDHDLADGISVDLRVSCGVRIGNIAPLS